MNLYLCNCQIVFVYVSKCICEILSGDFCVRRPIMSNASPSALSHNMEGHHFPWWIPKYRSKYLHSSKCIWIYLYSRLECRLSYRPCCPHQTRLYHSGTAQQLVLLTNFKILQEFPNTDCLILPDFLRRHHQESFHHSLWLHSQMIFLSGANINLWHFSITLGPDQQADVKCLQNILGSQTTTMDNK